MLEKREFYINGQWVQPSAANDCAVIDPSTEDPCTVISLGSQADTDAAVAAAKAALPGWMATPPSERIALVEKLIGIYNSRAEDLAKAMSTEMGAPIELSRSSQVGAGTWHLNGADEKMYKDLKASLASLNSSLARVDDLVRTMKEGKGLFARLAYDDDLADDVEAAVKSLKNVAERIDKGQKVTAPGVPANFADPTRLITDDCIRP